MNKEELIKFEEEVIKHFMNKEILAPIHLSVGSEESLIEIFKQIDKENDWVFSTHRSHYHALLKGIDKDWLKREIMERRSIHINNGEKKFLTSAIMAGVIPIAVGTAMALKRKKSSSKVWVFVGDMTAEMGIFHECSKYATRHDLPITFVVEDNGLSVNTPTQEVWGTSKAESKIIKYNYERKYPHQGCGQWLVF